MKKIFFTALILFSGLMSGTASASIIFDFEGTCNVDCSRFGLSDGSTFNELGALRLFDSTDTTMGSNLLISDIEYFTVFGIDFLTGHSILNLSTPDIGFIADNDIAGFILSSGGLNRFCYNFASSPCDTGFDSFVAASGIASGGSGHGPAQFTLAALPDAAVPEPASLTLLALGLVGIGFSRKKKTA